MRFKFDIKDRKTQVVFLSLIVLFSGIFFFTNLYVESCNTGTEIERIRCWENKVKDQVLKYGLDSTFNELDDFYSRDAVFARNCHGMMHIFGETGYELYQDDSQSVAYNKGMTECGYGFLHGFVEKLIEHEENGLKAAGEFCEALGNSQAELPPETIINDCFHGIGHGVIDDETGYGSLEALRYVVGEALSLCDGITSSDQYAGYCKDGAFHSTGLILMDNVDLNSFNKDDPLEFCQRFGEDEMVICHGSFASMVMAINDSDMSKALSYLGTIKNDDAAETYLRVLTAYRAFSSINERDFETWISECREVSERWFDKCINGLSIGLMDFSGPGEQASSALSLCQHDSLSGEESHICTSEVIRRTSAYLGDSEYEKLCYEIGKDFPEECK